MTTLTRPTSSRALVLAAAVSVALISTVGAYLAMVAFGIDVLAMDTVTAYATAGVFELSLVTVALLAREAAKDNRPGGTLLTLTWALSSASGAFAAWHELFIGHSAGAAIFRFLVPLLAALMWHLALIGDRHLATGQSWTGARQARRMHALFLATEDLFRAQHHGGRRLAAAENRRRRARATALRTVPPEAMRGQVATWCEALGAVGEGTADVARLHTEDRARMSAILTPGHHTPTRLSGPDTTPDNNPDTYAIQAAGHVAAEITDITTDTTRTRTGQPRRTAAATRPRRTATARTRTGVPGADKARRLAIVSAVLTDQPDATTSAALSALTTAGHHVTDRTARRLLSEARTNTTTTDTDTATTPDTTTDTTTDTTDTTAPTTAPVLAEVN